MLCTWHNYKTCVGARSDLINSYLSSTIQAVKVSNAKCSIDAHGRAWGDLCACIFINAILTCCYCIHMFITQLFSTNRPTSDERSLLMIIIMLANLDWCVSFSRYICISILRGWLLDDCFSCIMLVEAKLNYEAFLCIYCSCLCRIYRRSYYCHK